METMENNTVSSTHQEKAKKMKITPLADYSKSVWSCCDCLGSN